MERNILQKRKGITNFKYFFTHVKMIAIITGIVIIFIIIIIIYGNHFSIYFRTIFARTVMKQEINSRPHSVTDCHGQKITYI